MLWVLARPRLGSWSAVFVDPQGERKVELIGSAGLVHSACSNGEEERETLEVSDQLGWFLCVQ